MQVPIAWHGIYTNYTSKIVVLEKKAIRATNNLAYNEYTNAYFKCNQIIKLSDQYKRQLSFEQYCSIITLQYL